jgi:hypothetical protein
LGPQLKFDYIVIYYYNSHQHLHKDIHFYCIKMSDLVNFWIVYFKGPILNPYSLFLSRFSCDRIWNSLQDLDLLCLFFFLSDPFVNWLFIWEKLHTMVYFQITLACCSILSFGHSIQLSILILPSHSFNFQIIIK